MKNKIEHKMKDAIKKLASLNPEDTIMGETNYIDLSNILS